MTATHLFELRSNVGRITYRIMLSFSGVWLLSRMKGSDSIVQLSCRDAPDLRKTFMYRLSQTSCLHKFKNVLLCGSSQDRYVPFHSARIELCKAAVKDQSPQGKSTGTTNNASNAAISRSLSLCDEKRYRVLWGPIRYQ